MTRIVETTDAPAPVGPYSQAVVAGDLIFLAGQIGLDPATGRLVAGGAGAEVTRVLENLTAVLRAAGVGPEAVVRTTIYLVDLADGPVVNEAYARAFPAPHPARATVQVAALPAGARVEIEAIAARGASRGRAGTGAGA
jgi:2-iminobutanoate/2-iminopropanoate deaminase